MPRSIRLRCDALTPAQLLAQLSERLDVLADGPQDLPRRHQALRAAVDWSFDLLDAADRELVTRLGAFTGGFLPAAVAAVCVPEERDGPALTARLTTLADKSLLRSLAGPDGEARFTMLETIRAYAAERRGEIHPDRVNAGMEPRGRRADRRGRRQDLLRRTLAAGRLEDPGHRLGHGTSGRAVPGPTRRHSFLAFDAGFLGGVFVG